LQRSEFSLDTGAVFQKFLTPGPGAKKKQNSAGVDSGTQDSWPALEATKDEQWVRFLLDWNHTAKVAGGHFFSIRLLSCSKIFESGSGKGILLF